MNLEIEGAGKAGGADHADRVFGEASVGVADDADEALFEIFEAAGMINNGEVGEVIEEGVDREVTAKCIFFGGAKEIVAND